MLCSFESVLEHRVGSILASPRRQVSLCPSAGMEPLDPVNASRAAKVGCGVVSWQKNFRTEKPASFTKQRWNQETDRNPECFGFVILMWTENPLSSAWFQATPSSSSTAKVKEEAFCHFCGESYRCSHFFDPIKRPWKKLCKFYTTIEYYRYAIHCWYRVLVAQKVSHCKAVLDRQVTVHFLDPNMDGLPRRQWIDVWLNKLRCLFVCPKDTKKWGQKFHPSGTSLIFNWDSWCLVFGFRFQQSCSGSVQCQFLDFRWF